MRTKKRGRAVAASQLTAYGVSPYLSATNKRDGAPSVFKTGQIVELHTPAHPYKDQQMGFTDHGHIIPAKTDRMRVARVCKRADGVHLTLRHVEATTGYSVNVAKWSAFYAGRSIKVVGA